MHALLSTIGSRGDVQPLVALAIQLRALGHTARLCVPPDFREWIEALGFDVRPIGPELRKLTASAAATIARPPLTLEQRRQMAEASVTAQFETVRQAAQDCDIVVGATALQIAARSVAQVLHIPYVFAAFCPNVLPSPHHAPPPLPALPGQSAPATNDNRELWVRDTERFNNLFGDSLNAHRARLGLQPVDDVRTHVLTERPWLASDKTLGPWPDSNSATVFQTGAWIIEDDRPLSTDLERFLDDGAPPVYFGFGSIRATPDLSRVMIESARAVGRRVIVSRGWADLAPIDDAPDCLTIDEVNQQALFRRVAAVVHHGGAGTTTAAALSAAPQLIIPQMYDQHYWAKRVEELGIGTAHAAGAPTVESLTPALERTLESHVAARAAEVAPMIRTDGARVAAESVAERVISDRAASKHVNAARHVDSAPVQSTCQ
jgi:vancomycin aglycone glucosyltransferase